MTDVSRAMDRAHHLNRTISSNTREADLLAGELQSLSEAAGLMGQNHLSLMLGAISRRIVAQAEEVSRAYGESIHADFDESIACIAETINAALGARS